MVEHLTERELIVLHYLPTMLKAGEIASDLYVSVNTVKAHLRSMYRKLGVSNRREAVERARTSACCERCSRSGATCRTVRRSGWRARSAAAGSRPSAGRPGSIALIRVFRVLRNCGTSTPGGRQDVVGESFAGVEHLGQQGRRRIRSARPPGAADRRGPTCG